MGDQFPLLKERVRRHSEGVPTLKENPRSEPTPQRGELFQILSVIRHDRLIFIGAVLCSTISMSFGVLFFSSERWSMLRRESLRTGSADVV